MTELDYLKLAAAAGGLQIDFDKRKGDYFSIVGTPYFWNPGLNTQQAYELADCLRLMVDHMPDKCRILRFDPPGVSLEMKYPSAMQSGRMHINRLCIVRAAAEIQLARDRQAKGEV